MLKGFLMLAPVGLIGYLGLKRYIDNDELAECENFSVAGELAMKKTELENSSEINEDFKKALEEEIDKLQLLQNSIVDWENSNLVNRVIETPPHRVDKCKDMKILEKNLSFQLSKLKDKLGRSIDI